MNPFLTLSEAVGALLLLGILSWMLYARKAPRHYGKEYGGWIAPPKPKEATADVLERLVRRLHSIASRMGATADPFADLRNVENIRNGVVIASGYAWAMGRSLGLLRAAFPPPSCNSFEGVCQMLESIAKHMQIELPNAKEKDPEALEIHAAVNSSLRRADQIARHLHRHFRHEQEGDAPDETGGAPSQYEGISDYTPLRLVDLAREQGRRRTLGLPPLEAPSAA